MNTSAEAPLRAATYLGDNTLAIMRDLVGYLSRATGIEVVVDRTAGRSSAEARHRAPDLDLVWMCGYLTASLISTGGMSHKIVAAPIFPGYREAVYHSVMVTRPNGPSSLRAALETRVAVNELESWSGFLGLRAHVDQSFPDAWFATQTITGSHRASIQAVADRACDVAAIDITIWEYLLATEPEAAANLRVIDRTVGWPAPPFSLGSHLDPAVRETLTTALLATGSSDIPSLAGMARADSDLYRYMTRA